MFRLCMCAIVISSTRKIPVPFRNSIFRVSCSGDADHERNSTTSFAICDLVAGTPSSYSTRPSKNICESGKEKNMYTLRIYMYIQYFCAKSTGVRDRRALCNVGGIRWFPSGRFSLLSYRRGVRAKGTESERRTVRGGRRIPREARRRPKDGAGEKVCVCGAGGVESSLVSYSSLDSLSCFRLRRTESESVACV